jgi:hypothetical protein
MLNIVYGGADAFDAVLYGEKNPVNVEYFRSQVNNVSTTLTDIGKQFFANSNALFEQFHGSDAMRLAKAAVRTAKGLFTPNVVCSIFDIGGFQQAPLVMQRWIMANPVVRETYHKQACDGYSGTYVDMHPDDVGEKHYDYRRVMDNVVQDDDEGGWFTKSYIEELIVGDRDLLIREKSDILSTWQIVEMFMKAGLEDPTSASNNSL